MASDKVLAAVFNTIATILTWTSYGLGISSITSNRWIYVQSSNNSGLWRECYLNNCIIIATGEIRLHLDSLNFMKLNLYKYSSSNLIRFKVLNQLTIL